MNKYGLIAKIENAINSNPQITLNGALSVDMPMGEPISGKIFVYDMDYMNFSRELIGLYNIDTDSIETPNF